MWSGSIHTHTQGCLWVADSPQTPLTEQPAQRLEQDRRGGPGALLVSCGIGSHDPAALWTITSSCFSPISQGRWQVLSTAGSCGSLWVCKSLYLCRNGKASCTCFTHRTEEFQWTDCLFWIHWPHLKASSLLNSEKLQRAWPSVTKSWKQSRKF